VKPPPFDYHRPDDVQQALALLAEYGDDAKPLAGGQSLVPMMNFRIARPAHLIDILGLDELSYISAADDGGLRIGAATRQVTVERSPLVAAGWPLLTGALECVAHPQIRARGTIGGSLAHADPAAELPVAIAALDGTLRVRSVRGERTVGWRDFFRAPLQTSLADDELLVELVLPAPVPLAGASFREYAARHGDFAVAGAAALVTARRDGGSASLSLSLLAAGPAPVLWSGSSPDGVSLTRAGAREAAHAALDGAEIADSVAVPAAYRRRLLGGLAADALMHAAARSGEYSLSGSHG
jgi:aerobic carbon-monoxide dehydrogenase medium subunit